MQLSLTYPQLVITSLTLALQALKTSHTKIEKDQIHNGIMITQAERRLDYATLIKLTVSPDGEVDKEMQLLTVGKTGSTRANIQEMVEQGLFRPTAETTIDYLK